MNIKIQTPPQLLPRSLQLSLSWFPALVFSFSHFWNTPLKVLDSSCHPFYENLAWLLWITSLCLDLTHDGKRPSLSPPNVLSLAFPQLLPHAIVHLSQHKLPSNCDHKVQEVLERAVGAALGGARLADWLKGSPSPFQSELHLCFLIKFT